MGDLLSKEMLADLIINIINILILFFVARALLYKPVKRFLEQRREAVAKTQQEAELKLMEAEKEKERYARLTAENAEYRETKRAEAEERAREQAQKILDDANLQAKRITEQSRVSAEKEREKLLCEARDQLGTLAVDISEKILQREVSDEDNRRIINSFFDA